MDRQARRNKGNPTNQGKEALDDGESGFAINDKKPERKETLGS
jgi:hypothetical protein